MVTKKAKPVVDTYKVIIYEELYANKLDNL